MIYTVIGGSSSRKSEFAESIVKNLGTPNPVYLATMISHGGEDDRIIARHRQMRAQKHFQTLEKPVRLYEAEIPQGKTVLLECMSNLTANEMFDASSKAGRMLLEGGPGAYEDAGLLEKARRAAFEEVRASVDHLQRQSRDLVVVTGNVFEDGSGYAASTRAYLRLFSDANKYLAEISDVFVEMFYGCPLYYKGGDFRQLPGLRAYLERS